MALLSPDAMHLIERYGYGAVGVAIGIESIGIPFPGETTLVAAAIYAGTTGRMDIAFVILAAIAGAVIGDNIGFWLGREFGFKLLVRYGRYIRLTPPRIKLGQYLFLRHGGTVVFFGRFFALLRALAAFLAGSHGMTWPRFLFFNAAGGVVWACLYGGGAYLIGTQIERLLGPVGLVLGGLVTAAVIAGFYFAWRHEQRLTLIAERALPGPLEAVPMKAMKARHESDKAQSSLLPEGGAPNTRHEG